MNLQPGNKVNRWTVVEFVGITKYYSRKIKVQCECGTVRIRLEATIKNGSSKSCGCLQKEIMAGQKRHLTHGLRHQPEYRVYIGAKIRCTHPNRPDWPNYGGRGIEFRYTDFKEFWNDLGPRPSDKHEIDRIDNDGNYEPGNCRWVTRDVNAKNKRPRKRS